MRNVYEAYTHKYVNNTGTYILYV